MADTTVDPNSNITTVFKETPRPTLSVRDVSTPNKQEEQMVRGSIISGSTSKKPVLTKKRIRKPSKR